MPRWKLDTTSMKKYVKLKLQKELEYLSYHPTVDQLSNGVLWYFFITANAKRLIDLLNTNCSGLGYDFTEISWSKKNNAVMIEISWSYEEDAPPYDLFTMKLDNFITVVEDWAKLEEKRAPEIYFIQKDDGTIIVKEILE